MLFWRIGGLKWTMHLHVHAQDAHTYIYIYMILDVQSMHCTCVRYIMCCKKQVYAGWWIFIDHWPLSISTHWDCQSTGSIWPSRISSRPAGALGTTHAVAAQSGGAIPGSPATPGPSCSWRGAWWNDSCAKQSVFYIYVYVIVHVYVHVYVEIYIPWRIHGAGIYMLILGVYWWDPCYH